MFERTKAAGLTKGLPERNTASITNLQYVDDTLIFENCNLGEAIVIKCILVCFEAWSDLQINYHKSFLVNLGRRNLAIMFIQNFWL